MQIVACGLLWDFCLHCGCILMAYEDGPSPPLDSYSVDYCSLPPCMIFVLESGHCPATRKINGCTNSKIVGRYSERQTACTATISVIGLTFITSQHIKRRFKDACDCLGDVACASLPCMQTCLPYVQICKFEHYNIFCKTSTPWLEL